MAGDAAAELRADLAEGKVDLVVERDDPLEADAELAAGGAGRLAGLVHEGLRQQDRDAGAAGPDPPLGDQAAVAFLRRAAAPSAS